MKRFIFLLIAFLFLVQTASAAAIEDPTIQHNNRVGIHILFPSELQDAAKLINSQGGDWGYVTIPIQSHDRDLVKWQSFMDDCKKYHIIPLLRLATEGDYFNTTVWRKPTEDDVVDFANFLDSLSWPTKNRYVIVFNEVNRGDEWGGAPNASEYANLLSFSVSTFKQKSQDFFIISAGLDNAAPNLPGVFENEYSFMQDMASAVPSIYASIDGLASHSYPNPGFSQPPTSQTTMSAMSFRYEQTLAKSLSGKSLPEFITETGWSSAAVSDDMRASYYITAFTTIWNDSSVIAVTPFLLNAGAGPFKVFGFFNPDGTQSQQYKAIATLAKVKGTPTVVKTSPQVLAASDTRPIQIATVDFTHDSTPTKKYHITSIMTGALDWIFKL